MSYDFKLDNSLHKFDRLDLDIALDYKGGFKTVENNYKLIQDTLKILLTEKASNIFHTDYGSEIRKFIGVADRDEIIEPALRGTTEDALSYYTDLQKEQILIQFVSLQERIQDISFINVQWMGNNPERFLEEPNLPAQNAKLTYIIEIGLITGENVQLVLNLKET